MKCLRVLLILVVLMMVNFSNCGEFSEIKPPTLEIKKDILQIALVMPHNSSFHHANVERSFIDTLANSRLQACLFSVNKYSLLPSKDAVENKNTFNQIHADRNKFIVTVGDFCTQYVCNNEEKINVPVIPCISDAYVGDDFKFQIKANKKIVGAVFESCNFDKYLRELLKAKNTAKTTIENLLVLYSDTTGKVQRKALKRKWKEAQSKCNQLGYKVTCCFGSIDTKKDVQATLNEWSKVDCIVIPKDQSLLEKTDEISEWCKQNKVMLCASDYEYLMKSDCAYAVQASIFGKLAAEVIRLCISNDEKKLSRKPIFDLVMFARLAENECFRGSLLKTNNENNLTKQNQKAYTSVPEHILKSLTQPYAKISSRL